MQVLQDVPLKLHSTMRLGGTAAYAATITSLAELTEALAWAEAKHLPAMMIGGGSNIVWRDQGYPGLLLINALQGFTVTDDSTDSALVTIAAGESWDAAVARTVAQGLSGIEALSLIPGTTGGTPVQNVGAYGQEIAQTLVHVEAYDSFAKQVVTIPGNECGFAYRTSRFKAADKGRYYILGITLRLSKSPPQPPFYAALQRYLDDHAITSYSPSTIRQAVIAIRTSKLPDPALVANNGSFFGNPIIEQAVFAPLQAKYPDMPHWPMPDGRIKIPAAWLVEQAGFKDHHDKTTGMGTWPAQCLVLVNESAQTTQQLLDYRDTIAAAVHQTFGLSLEQEPELLP